MVANAIPVPAPTPRQSRQAQESMRRLAPYTGRELTVEITRRGRREAITLPASAVQLLVELLTQMAAGSAVTLLPVQAQLTTQQAADLLGVSRPFIVKQIKQGQLPSRKIGAHRRILLSDLLAYKARIDRQRLKALGELAAQAQDLNMGY